MIPDLNDSSPSRIDLTEHNGDLQIVIRTQRHAPTIVSSIGLIAAGIAASIFFLYFLLLMIFPRLFGQPISVAQPRGELLPYQLIMAFTILVTWSAVFMIGLMPLLWQLEGTELIEINEHSIKITRSSGGFSRTKELLAQKVYGLLLMPEESLAGPFDLIRRSSIFSGWYAGYIGISIPKGIYRFADGITAEEAQSLLETILMKYPAYAYLE